MNYKNWLQLILEKGILRQDSTSRTVLIKMRYASYWNIFNLNSMKEFCFYSSVQEAETLFDILIFWVGGKNCIVKNEKCILFPGARCVNSNPDTKNHCQMTAVSLLWRVGSSRYFYDFDKIEQWCDKLTLIR